MLEELHHYRKIRDEEYLLVKYLLESNEKYKKIIKLSNDCMVVDLQDGCMGSIRFKSNRLDKRAMKEVIAECDFIDKDNILVSISLTVDGFNKLYELDFWKVDFSPLIEYPKILKK